MTVCSPPALTVGGTGAARQKEAVTWSTAPEKLTPLPTVIPAPNEAVVTFWTNCVYWAFMVTATLLPAAPELGATERSWGGGVARKTTEFELWNFVPAVVLPAMEMR